MKTLYSSCIVLGILLSAAAHAETIITTRLHALHGKILAQTPEWVEVSTEFGTLRIAREDIARIEQDTPGMDAECSETAYRSKDFADKMIAEGKVLYHGRWVTPEERAEQEARVAEATQRAADDLAERERRDAEEAQREAAARADVDDQIRAEERRYYIRHQAAPGVRQYYMNNPDYR